MGRSFTYLKFGVLSLARAEKIPIAVCWTDNGKSQFANHWITYIVFRADKAPTLEGLQLRLPKRWVLNLMPVKSIRFSCLKLNLTLLRSVSNFLDCNVVECSKSN